MSHKHDANQYQDRGPKNAKSSALCDRAFGDIANSVSVSQQVTQTWRELISGPRSEGPRVHESSQHVNTTEKSHKLDANPYLDCSVMPSELEIWEMDHVLSCHNDFGAF